MLKLLSVYAVMLSLLCAPVRAQQAGSPEAVAAATKLIAVISTEMTAQMSSAMTNQMWPQMQASLAGKVDNATIADLRSEFERILAKFMASAMADAPAVYGRYFSVQELNDIAAFYRTPTGIKSLKLSPQIMTEFMSTVMPRMPQFQQELKVSIDDVMRKHGVKQ